MTGLTSPQPWRSSKFGFRKVMVLDGVKGRSRWVDLDASHLHGTGGPLLHDGTVNGRLDP
jgi:hypothetical protein